MPSNNRFLLSNSTEKFILTAISTTNLWKVLLKIDCGLRTMMFDQGNYHNMTHRPPKTTCRTDYLGQVQTCAFISKLCDQLVMEPPSLVSGLVNQPEPFQCETLQAPNIPEFNALYSGIKT
ncbi:hypothetical protein VP01_1394g1 [Puccinia sorghi]|uniref:Uncharacterized protein n=1 Tax=Puccinia sorghi TaxID=27349 RepID=A0A0L6VL94_9BASI|nr:hypothetical protein VP01_1394g1 [Puccinia sorghi]